MIEAKGARSRASDGTHGEIDPPRLALADHEDPPTADVWLGLDLDGNVLPLLVKFHHLHPQLQTLSQLSPPINKCDLQNFERLDTKRGDSDPITTSNASQENNKAVCLPLW